MKKAFVLIRFHLGVWGILGFFATLILGFLSCSMHIEESAYLILLGILSIVGISASVVCVMRSCAK